VAIGALAVLTTLAGPVGLKFVVHEVIRVYVANQHDIATAAAIAAVGAAPRLIFFAAEADASPSAVAGR
jgi:hypothetical protein